MPDVVLKAEHVTKRFGGITALEDAQLELYKGEVHALVGANGAGKSTLIKIITGAYSSDEGDIYLDGQKVDIKSTFDARAKGISAVYQEFSLINTVSVAENIYMGKLLYNNLGPIPRADWKRMNEETQKILNSLGVKNIKPETIVGRLSVAQKQMVEIAKALSNDLKVLIMDEPTASLSDNEIENMFKIVKDLRAKGISIVYVSHRLEELPIICDRISVYRDGHYIKTMNIEDAPKQVIIENMVGKNMTQTEQSCRSGRSRKNRIRKSPFWCGPERFRTGIHRRKRSTDPFTKRCKESGTWLHYRGPKRRRSDPEYGSSHQYGYGNPGSAEKRNWT